MKHLLALCAVYKKSAAELGLLRRADMPALAEDDDAAANGVENPFETNQSSAGYADPSETSQPSESGARRGRQDLMLSVLLRVLLGDGGSGTMRRDDFIKGVGAATGAAFVDPFASLSQQARDEMHHTKISNDQLGRLTKGVYQHANSFYQLNDQELLGRLVADWTSTQRLLSLPATHAQRTELLNVYARQSGILGAFATGRLEDNRAQALLEAARDAAQSSGDTDLVGWVHGRFCVIENRRNAFDEVVALANGGLNVLGSSKTATAANLHGWVARGYAAMGAKGAARVHLESAERILRDATAGCWPNERNTPRAFTFREDGLQRTMAMTNLRLGDYAAVIKHCDQADAIFEGLGLSARTVTPVMGSRMTRSEALLRSGELEGATQIATAALQSYEGVAIPVQLRRARRIERELTSVDKGGTYAKQFSEFLRDRAV